MKLTLTVVFVLILFAPLAPAFAQNEAAPEEIHIDDLEKIIGVSRIWKDAEYNFSYFDHVPDLDWDAEYRLALEEAQKARNAFEYYRVLQKFIAKLKDDHTRIDLPQAMAEKNFDGPRLQTRAISRQAVVTNVDSKIADEVPIGSLILEVDGKKTAEVLQEDVFPYLSSTREEVAWMTGVFNSRYRGAGLLLGRPGSTVKLKIEPPDGHIRSVRLKRDRYLNQDDVKWLIEPPSSESFEFREIEPGIGYLDIDSFMDSELPEKFEQLLPKLQALDGLIIDLRENLGGNSDYAFQIAAHLTDKPLQLPRFSTRQHVASFKAMGQIEDVFPGTLTEEEIARYLPYAKGEVWLTQEFSKEELARWAPRGSLTTKPVVVLTDIFTASASELFLITLDPLPNVTVVGEQTNGNSGQPYWVFLPGGGRARIASERSMFPDGQDFTGVGITPDILAPRTVSDIRNQEDSVLAAGVSELRQKIGQ